MRNRRGNEGQSEAAVPLDQVSSARLVRASAEYEPRPVALPPLRPARTGAASGGWRFLMAVLLPPCFFALAAVMFFGLARGTAGKLAGDGSFSAADAALLLLLVIAAASVFGQGLGLLRRHPRGRKLLTRGRAAVPHRTKAEPTRPPPLPLLLDQVTVDALLIAAPPGLGTGSRVVAAGRTTWRSGDTILWIVLGAISVGVAAVAAFGMGFSVWRALKGGSYTPALILLAVFCGMAFMGLSAMARVTVAAIFDRRRRKRRPAFLRLTRYGAKPMAGGDSAAGGGASAAASAAITAVAAITMVSATFWPEVSDALGALGGDEAPVLAAAVATPTARATPTPPPLATPTPTPTPAPAATATSSPTRTPTLTPTPTPTPAPAATATSSPTRTPTLTPTPRPTLGPPTPTSIGRPSEFDGDKIITAIEEEYGSDPHNGLSTPEDWRYDEGYGKTTCTDGVDNDLDGATDNADPGCQ